MRPRLLTIQLVALVPVAICAACSFSSTTAKHAVSEDAGAGVSVGGCPGVVCGADAESVTCECISGQRSSLVAYDLTTAVGDCADVLAHPACCEDTNHILCYCSSETTSCPSGEMSVTACNTTLVGDPTSGESAPPNSCALAAE